MSDDANVSLYFERKHIPELMEALVAGLSFNRPEDPVEFLSSCLQDLKSDKLHPVPKWDRFLKESKAAQVAREQGKQPAQLPASFFFRQSANTASDNGAQKGKISPEKIVLVLGGPGSGKGTQCAKIVEDFGMKHISLGDLLRAEVNKASSIGQQIDGMMKEGKIVPMNIVMQVLQQALNELGQTSRGVLIDGFPREMDQAVEFERLIGKVNFVLFFECSESLLEKRLLKRGETSGRSDDNIESIKKRFRTFKEQSLPVIDFYQKQGRLLQVNSEGTVDEVYAQIKPRFTTAFPGNSN